MNEDHYFDFNKGILDIGAFVGVYSFMTPFKFAYCFEPNFESYSLLNVNMLHNEKLHFYERMIIWQILRKKQ